jgi:hypothetical protein
MGNVQPCVHNNPFQKSLGISPVRNVSLESTKRANKITAMRHSLNDAIQKRDKQLKEVGSLMKVLTMDVHVFMILIVV